MCDIDAKTRRCKYAKLRKAGWNRNWSMKIRDYSENHYNYHLNHPVQVKS